MTSRFLRYIVARDELLRFRLHLERGLIWRKQAVGEVLTDFELELGALKCALAGQG